MARKNVSRAKGGTITISTQTIRDLIAQVAELKKEIAALRQEFSAKGGAPAKGGKGGTKAPRRVSALQLYIKAVSDKHKKAVQRKNKSLTGLKLYMAAKKAATEEFNKFTPKQKYKYQREADKINEANGLGKVKTPSTKKAAPKKAAPKKEESDDESGSESDDESGSESDDESGSESDDESGSESDDESGSKSEDESGSESDESGSGSDADIFDELSETEDEEPPKKGSQKKQPPKKKPAKKQPPKKPVKKQPVKKQTQKKRK